MAITIPISTDDIRHLYWFEEQRSCPGRAGRRLERNKGEDTMRTLRAVVLLVVVLLVAGGRFRYPNGYGWPGTPHMDRPTVTNTSGAASVETARERGAEVGEKV